MAPALAGLLFGLLGGAPEAAAGDLASRAIIGFSSDGGAFAFEEFGRQDGSGFAYANVYLIDTIKNGWIAGSPVRVLIKRDGADVAMAREQALEGARPLLARSGIQKGRKGRLLASNPVTELGVDPHRVTVVPRPVYPAIDDPVRFVLHEFPVASKRCRRFAERQTVGMALRVQVGERPPEQIHRDTRIPRSRGCPRSYAISDVIYYEPRRGRGVYILLISVFRLGFEGPDRRFISAGYWTQ